jgi:two-component system sensor histidine kinase CpxA
VRSVYTKILLWSFATLVLSLVAFVGVSVVVSFQSAFRNGFFGPASWELEEARQAYEEGGAAKLSRFVARMERHLPGRYYLTDAAGHDLATGGNRSALLAIATPEGSKPPLMRRQPVIMAVSADGRYRWIVQMGAPPFHISSYLPYYFLIFVAVGFVCWLLAVNIASPLRVMARTVDQFGAGDLSARVNSNRKDELGELGRAFDRMAERIATLLTAERRLLQDISHELRTPLARLSFAAELTRTAADREAAVSRLKKEIHRLTDLVSALLEVTRSEGDPTAASLQRLRLDDLLTDVIEDCRLEADGHGCEITLRAGTPTTVVGDRELLRRAIENVVRNSIRYAPDKSAVEVQLDATPGAARISVRDYGPGVPADALPKIFHPFFRVDDSRDSSNGGVGLGLAIAMRAIGLHHGNMRAENAAPGLRVSIELPVDATS